MSIVSRKRYEDADADVRDIWDAQVRDHGRMTHMKQTLAHCYQALRCYMDWYPLRDEVQAFLGERPTLVFVHALSSATDCLICSTYFRRILIDAGEDPDQLHLDDREALLVDYARALAHDANDIPPEVMRALTEWLTDEHMVTLTAFAGIMVATNLFANALAIDLDEYLYPYRKPAEDVTHG